MPEPTQLTIHGAAEPLRPDTAPYWGGHALAPAFMRCGACGERKLDRRKSSSFGIGSGGRLLCPPCWQRDIAQLDREPLFAAPQTMRGQLAMPTDRFTVGVPVGPGRTWGEVQRGDTFRLPSGETLVVKSRTKRHATFYGERTIDGPINVVHDIHPGAVYMPTDTVQ